VIISDNNTSKTVRCDCQTLLRKNTAQAAKFKASHNNFRREVYIENAHTTKLEDIAVN